MNQSLEKLEINVYQLAQKFETLIGENRRLNEEINRLKLEQEQQKREHETAVDELSEALLVQVGKLKDDLQSKIDSIANSKGPVNSGDTTYININTMMIGEDDNSSGWWSAFSDYFTIPTNKLLHLEFINHTTGANNWNNWNGNAFFSSRRLIIR